jgi:hypothetical protein
MPAKSIKQKQPKQGYKLGNLFDMFSPTKSTPTRRRSSSRRRSSIKRRLSSKQRHASHAKTTARHGERLYKQEGLVNLMGDTIAKGKADRKSDINKLKKELEEIRKHNNGDPKEMIDHITHLLYKHRTVTAGAALTLMGLYTANNSKRIQDGLIGPDTGVGRWNQARKDHTTYAEHMTQNPKSEQKAPNSSFHQMFRGK